MNEKATIGVIGLGVMGRSLALNLVNHDIKTAIHNVTQPGETENKAEELGAHSGLFVPCRDLKELVDCLESPRKILLMIKAGEPVDTMLELLSPLLDEGDILIDGGNSHFEDTLRRTEKLATNGQHFVGMGVSGGEQGALKGPSMMPGGPQAALDHLYPIIERIAAKNDTHQPCIVKCEGAGAGHFVKMVHNGIEYGEMQLLAEVYDLLKCSGYTEFQIADLLQDWIGKGHGSYLLETTVAVLRHKEAGEPLLPKIRDVARQKGTGSWTTIASLQQGIPGNTISEAVHARLISAQKSVREKHHQNPKPIQSVDMDQLLNAWSVASLINHHIGFEIIRNTASERNWTIDLSEVASAWTSGCIIRSELMKSLVGVFSKSQPFWMTHHLHPSSKITAKR